MIVLSTHIDDAAFSLGATMAGAAAAGEPVHVVNVFTAYRPAKSSTKRAAEEDDAIRAIGPLARTTLLGLQDALARRQPPRDLYRPGGLVPSDADVLARVSEALQPHIGSGACFVPLAVGDHIDHLLVLQAALRLVPPQAICFYEDLPYAGAMAEAQVAQYALRAQALGAAPLQPRVLPFTAASARAKEAIVAAYQSQLDDSTLASINAAGNRHGGERIWVPQARQPGSPAAV